MEEKGWSLLLEAIVTQAIRDYERALRKRDKRLKADCETFFKSQWFMFLCDIEGDFFLNFVQIRVKEKKKCIPRKKSISLLNG